jgi:hypothetical protein
VDEEFATYLARSNTVQKSLTAAMSRTAGKARAPDGVQPPQRVVPEIPRSPTCPKCHFGHFLRDCPRSSRRCRRTVPGTTTGRQSRLVLAGGGEVGAALPPMVHGRLSWLRRSSCWEMLMSAPYGLE